MKAVKLDLADKASIEAAVGELGGPVDALFSCAGVADGTPGIERINFIGHRHFIDRMLADDLLPRGSAIGLISSAAGMGWQANLELLNEYLDITDFDAARRAGPRSTTGPTTCGASSRSTPTWRARRSRMLKRGIRINAIMPGPTDTPLARANAEMWLGFGSDFREEVGIEASTPLEQAYPLVFLCSDAAGAVNGITMITDAGYWASGVTESFPAAAPVIGFLSGKF